MQLCSSRQRDKKIKAGIEVNQFICLKKSHHLCTNAKQNSLSISQSFKWVIVELKPSRGAVTVHCREACSVAPACLPGHSQAHTPRGRPSPTATFAGSASGSPARRRRTGPMPGSSSPAGQPCVGAVSTVSTRSVGEEKYPTGKIISLKMTPDSWRKLLTQNWLDFAEADLCLHHPSDRDLRPQS